MALEFFDGFDHYTNSTQMQRKGWDTSGIFLAFGTGRFGGSSITTTVAGTLYTPVFSSVSTRVVGVAVKPAATMVNYDIILLNGTSAQLICRLLTSGQVSVMRGGTTLGTSAVGTPMALDNWYYIEFKATIDPSAGSYEVKVWGGSTPGVWLTGSGVNTANSGGTTCNKVGLTLNEGNYRTDDFYCLNTSGSVNNNYLGDSRVLTSLPTGDSGTNAQWTPNSGTTHYTQVDDSNPDDDSTYVSSGTAAHIDTYTYASISPTGAIAGVQMVLTARKDDAGTRILSGAYRIGSTNYGSGSMSTGDSYSMLREITEASPATSAAWTSAEINAAEFGMKVVS